MTSKAVAEEVHRSGREEARPEGGARPALSVVVSATFTAEPLEPSLRFWLGELGFDGSVAFAPYNQVLQQLLDPSSESGRNAGGVNAVLVRFEDWGRFRRGADDESVVLENGVNELAGALRSFTSRSSTPLLLAVCPPSPAVAADPSRAALYASAESRLRDGVAGAAAVHWVGREALDCYPVGEPYDARRDQVGHMPYTPAFYTALGTALARRLHAVKTPRAKVIALDCDNTLWKGVVGEDGPLGVSFPPGIRALHEFVALQQASGVLVCLVSKNVEEDVLAVFEARPEMPLTRGQVVAMRVNWLPKSENLRSLAAELNLGLDAFVFVDDNPVECAEMRAACPEVLTLQLPAVDGEIPGFLRHLWPLDAVAVTEEDRRRTEMYRENAQRERFERESGGIESFLAGLELKVDIGPPSDDQVARVAQLTQRTNQFNLTTVRRGEAEILGLGRAGKECLRVEVSDRFGDYGLVGVMVLAGSADGVEVETMLLSCRVLGRGVEHAMLAHVGRLALERGKARVDVAFAPTAKNQPAANFVELVGSAYAEPRQGRAVYRIPAAVAAAVRYAPGGDAAEQLELARERPKAPAGSSRASSPARDRSTLYQRIATELRDVAEVTVAAERNALGTRPELETPYVAPRNELERDLAGLWARLLGLDRVGVLDDFTALGGTSLRAAHLFVEIDERYGRKLPMTTLLDAPTVELLAARVEASGAGSVRETLKLLRPVATDSGPGQALFLVHDGDGETLLYLNLARRLPPEIAVYGIEPLGNDRCPMRHTRIPEMAAHYLTEVRRVQPEGPYLLGGMCAGGTIAFEMARQLEESGESVSFLGLLDPGAPLAETNAGLASSRRWERFSRAMHAEQGSALRRFGRKVAKAVRKVKNLVTYELSRRTTETLAQFRFRALRKAADAGRPVPRLAEGLTVRQTYVRAEREYLPAGALAAPVVLFRATSGEGADEPFANLYTDPLLGWGRWVKDGPEVVDVPGGHSSMLQEPHVAVMAGRIREALSRQPLPAVLTGAAEAAV